MHELLVGSEALASGALTRQALRAHYDKVHQNVYAPKGLTLTPSDNARAAWLWSRREAVLVGSSAAAMLGTKRLPTDEPAELARSQFRSPKGIVAYSGTIADDIGRRIPTDDTIIRGDALLNATRVPVAAVTSNADRYPARATSAGCARPSTSPTAEPSHRRRPGSDSY